MMIDFLDQDADSVLRDTSPDLSKYLFIHSSIDDAGLDPYEFRVFCHLRRRAREEDNVAYPGMRKISEVTGISLSRVCVAIAGLQKKGFLLVQQRGRHLSNVYFVSIPAEREGVRIKNTPPEGCSHKEQGVLYTNTRESKEGNPSLRSSSSCSSNTSEKNSEHDVFSAAPKKKKTKLTVESVIQAVPPDLTLQSPSFLRAWRRWVQNRLELPKATIGSFEEHMEKCKRWGEDRAIAAIHHSIASSYLSIFEPNQNGRRKTEGAPAGSNRVTSA